MQLRQLQIGHHTPLCPPINATLRRGALSCLVGRNGSGKTTLLRTLAGLLAPLAGEVTLDGVQLSHYSASELARRISVVVTTSPDLPSATVEWVVGMGRLPYTSLFSGLHQSDRQAVDRALDAVGIVRLAHRRLTELSDGERQKVMVARALAQETDIILLDEPSAYLDYPSRNELYELLSHIARTQSKAILVSTHDIETASRMADTFWHLSPTGLVEVVPSTFHPTEAFA